MAKKYLTSFKPSDVLMVVLRCVRCGGELSFPVNDSSPMPTIAQCYVCGARKDPSGQSSNPIREARNLLQALRNVSADAVTADAVTDNVEPDKTTTWTVRLVIESGSGSTGEDA